MHVRTINIKTELKILKRRALIHYGQENEVKVLCSHGNDSKMKDLLMEKSNQFLSLVVNLKFRKLS